MSPGGTPRTLSYMPAKLDSPSSPQALERTARRPSFPAVSRAAFSMALASRLGMGTRRIASCSRADVTVKSASASPG